MALVFDATYYLSQNPDVLAAAAAGLTTAEAHFNNFGWKELRNPNAVFDTSDYLTTYADVLAAQINPLTHFLAYGAAESRTPSATYATIAASFDSANYLSANPDVQTAVTAGTIASAYQHWVLYGQYETGRPVAQLTNGTLVSTIVSTGTTGITGTTFTLTTGPDNVSGTANNDTVNGTLVYASAGTTVDATSTLSVADVIDGGAGNDTLSLIVQGGNGDVTFPSANVSNVETLSIRNLQATAHKLTVDASGLTGLTTVVSDRSAREVEVTNFADGNTFKVLGNNSAATNGASTIGYKTTAVTANLALDGGVGPTGTTAGTVAITGTGLKTLNITSTGAANTIGTLGNAASVETININATTNLTTGAPTSAGAKALNIEGAGAVTVGGNIASLTSIDASKSTGGATVTISQNTTSFTGGTGNDSVNIGTTVFNGSKALAGGTGTDTLKIAESTATVFTAAAKANISSFEILEVSGDSKTFDFEALTGLTAMNIGAVTTAGTVNNLGAATPVTVIANSAALTLNVKDATAPTSTADKLTLTLNLDNKATDNGVTLANLTSNGLETLDIVSAGIKATSASVHTITTLAGLSTSNVSTINITGDSGLTMATGAINKTVNINGAAATGKLTIDATLNTSTTGLTGGSAADKLAVTNAANDVLSGGAGNDKLMVVAATGAVGTGANSMTGGDGADSFVFGGAADNSAPNALVALLTSSTVAANSAVTNLNKITDFNFSQSDKILLRTDASDVADDAAALAELVSETTNTTITPGAFSNAGTITAGDLNAAITAAYADSNQVTSGSQALAGSAAVLFQWNDGTSTRSFISVNDSTGAYAAADDLVIEVTGITLKSGDASLGSLTVADYFG